MIEEIIIKIKEGKASGEIPEALALLFGKYKIPSGMVEAARQYKQFKTN